MNKRKNRNSETWKEKNRPRNAALQRAWRSENKERLRAKAKQDWADLKFKLLSMYGNTCALCGFSDRRALSLDHINGGGAMERRIVGSKQVMKLAASFFQPDKFRILCLNCQWMEFLRRRQ